MNNLLWIWISLALSVCSMTNRQAQQCFQMAIESNKCIDSLSECYSNQECSEEINNLNCQFLDNDYLYSGYCFAKWQQNSNWSKPFIDCIVDQCSLTANKEYNVTRFMECIQQTIQGAGEVQCGQECNGQLKEVQACTKRHPIAQCYKEIVTNLEAQQILGTLRQACLYQDLSMSGSQPGQQL